MRVRKFDLVLLSAFSLTGCFSNVNPQTAAPMTAEETSQYAEVTPTQLVTNAETMMQKANDAEFTFFAPGTLKRMDEQLKEMRALAKNPVIDKQQLINMARNVDQLYRSGTSNKGLVLAQLAEVLDQRKVLEKMSAARLYPSDYKDAVEDIVDLVEYIENGKPDKARGETPTVMQDMRKLEIRIVKDTVLGRATALLAEAKDKDAKDIARKGYDEASLAYDRAVKFIDTNPRDQEQIERLGSQATFLAQRSVRLAEEVAKLKLVKPRDFEQVVVESETQMQRIAEALHHPDVRDLTLTEQSVTLAKAADKLANTSDKQSAADAVKLKADLALAQENIKKLESSLAQSDAEKKAIQAKLAELNVTPRISESGVAQPIPSNEIKTVEPVSALTNP